MKNRNNEEANKPMKNPTTNYPQDSHNAFCERCLKRYNNGVCPETGKASPSKKCSI